MPSEESVQPVVSVCIVTYRHGKYIRSCIEAVLAQRTPFPFEILIGEDQSDDGTREICQELAAAHPDRIRLFLRERKDVVYVDGRPRGTFNMVATLAEARGEFVALCEGDDCWTDPEKLAIQVAYLRENPDCVGCFHETSVVDGDGVETEAEYFKGQEKNPKSKYNQHDCIFDLMSKYATCSLLFRAQAFREPPRWFLQRSCDFFLDIAITREGTLGFIDRRMAAYRRHAGGIWTGLTRVSQILEILMRHKLLLNDPFFREKYGPELTRRAEEFQNMLVLADELYAAQNATGRESAQVEALRRELASLAAERDLLRNDRDQLVEIGRKLLADKNELLNRLEKTNARPAMGRRK